jgi:hypothetical protein
MQVILLVLFVGYLYVPYLLFKFFTEESIDLVHRRDVTRVEEFFGAALPSALLNAATILLVRILDFGRETIGVGITMPPVDWRVVSGLFDPQLVAFRRHIAGGPSKELLYLAFLYVVSGAAGWAYGSVELRLMERGATAGFFRVPGSVQNTVRWAFALAFRRIWLPFFAESVHPLAPWMAKETWLFVRTKDDRLYYGRLLEYINNGAGDIDSITLTSVQRYARKTVAECLASGRCPLSRLSGSFVMKWSEVADVNVASPDVMVAIRRQYAVALRAYRDSKKKPRTLMNRARHLFLCGRRQK